MSKGVLLKTQDKWSQWLLHYALQQFTYLESTKPMFFFWKINDEIQMKLITWTVTVYAKTKQIIAVRKVLSTKIHATIFELYFFKLYSTKDIHVYYPNQTKLDAYILPNLSPFCVRVQSTTVTIELSLYWYIYFIAFLSSSWFIWQIKLTY